MMRPGTKTRHHLSASTVLRWRIWWRNVWRNVARIQVVTCWSAVKGSFCYTSTWPQKRYLFLLFTGVHGRSVCQSIDQSIKTKLE